MKGIPRQGKAGITSKAVKGEPLPLVSLPTETLQNYLGETNVETVRRLAGFVEEALDGPPPIAPLLILGPRGSGKTHLARAVSYEIRRRGGEAICLELAAAGVGLGGQLLAAGGWSRYDCVVVDGLEILKGRRADEEALLACLVDVAHHGPPLLLTLRGGEIEMTGSWSLPDVESRLRACEVAVLQSPREDERREVLRAHFRAWGMPISDEVIDWLEAHAARDLKTLTSLATRLVYEAWRRKRKINPSFAGSVLRDRLTDTGAGASDE